ncbi:major facilitator superfamily domain-containing protein [Lactarius akahatsu]|uniref:Major facilitator superfamily domain-containing protein n=1 Tax=Lactarius akahatsu TaxID=416441 RepID=A0AAD4LC25_9AGAM|nr:major facilitator superfamily domain-containing protein [Lactarius akahatsu]
MDSHSPSPSLLQFKSAQKTQSGEDHAAIAHGVPKDWKFWCIIFSLALSVLLTAVEFTAIGAALPTIIRDLQGLQFIWVGSAYALGSTALVPFCGGLTQIIGRRPIMLSALFLFALGSTICGAASSMNMLIAGRAVQGLGAGAITSSVQIMLSDLVTLRERGTFSGLMALSWAVGGGVGPVIGGSLAQSGHCADLNLPICAFNATLVLLFMRLRTPHATLREKLSKIDFIGNLLITGSTTSIVIGLTWGGVQFPWSSASVLVPLVLGFVGLVAFVIYEFYFCKPPTAPILFRLDWTGTSGYLQNFVMAVVLASLSYWYAVFFEACKDRSPSGAGVDIFGLSYSISLIAIIAGVVVKKTGKYLAPTYIGWALMVVGAGLLTTLRADSSIAKSVGFQLVIGGGVGIIYVVSLFPILASPLRMALYVFSRNFGYIWGVTVGGAILQNELKKNLPASFLAQFPHGVQLAFSAIPTIPTLEQPLKAEVQNTFGEALKVVWQVVLGVSSAGFVSSLGMRQLQLHTNIDEDWGREDIPIPIERRPSSDMEMLPANGNLSTRESPAPA